MTDNEIEKKKAVFEILKNVGFSQEKQDVLKHKENGYKFIIEAWSKVMIVNIVVGDIVCFSASIEWKKIRRIEKYDSMIYISAQGYNDYELEGKWQGNNLTWDV